MNATFVSVIMNDYWAGKIVWKIVWKLEFLSLSKYEEKKKLFVEKNSSEKIDFGFSYFLKGKGTQFRFQYWILRMLFQCRLFKKNLQKISKIYLQINGGSATTEISCSYQHAFYTRILTAFTKYHPRFSYHCNNITLKHRMQCSKYSRTSVYETNQMKLFIMFIS